MDRSKLQNLSPWNKFQYVFTWYLLTMLRFLYDIAVAMKSHQNVINLILDPLKNKLGKIGDIDLMWIPAYTVIKICLIFMFAPFLFMVRITTSIIWIASKFGKVPAFIYSITGTAFVFATWHTISWMLKEYQSIPKKK